MIDNMRYLLSEAGWQIRSRLTDLLPDVGIAVLIIGIGLIVSAVLYTLVIRILAFFAVDKLVGKTPLDRFLKGFGIRKNVSEILGLLVFWFGVFVTLIVTTDVLELHQVSALLAIVTRFIPQLIAVIVAVVLGVLLARFLQVLTEQSLQRAGMKTSRTAGTVVYIAVLFIVAFFVLDRFGGDIAFIATNLVILIAAVTVITAVGIIIAARTLLENAIACYQLRQSMQVGQRVRIGSAEGVIGEFTLTSVVLTRHGEQSVIPASSFFTQPYSLVQSDGGNA